MLHLVFRPNTYHPIRLQHPHLLIHVLHQRRAPGIHLLPQNVHFQHLSVEAILHVVLKIDQAPVYNGMLLHELAPARIELGHTGREMWKDVGFLSGVVPVDLVDERDGREEEFLLGEVPGPAGGSGCIVYEVVISAEVVVLRIIFGLSLLFLAWVS